MVEVSVIIAMDQTHVQGAPIVVHLSHSIHAHEGFAVGDDASGLYLLPPAALLEGCGGCACSGMNGFSYSEAVEGVRRVRLQLEMLCDVQHYTDGIVREGEEEGHEGARLEAVLEVIEAIVVQVDDCVARDGEEDEAPRADGGICSPGLEAAL